MRDPWNRPREPGVEDPGMMAPRIPRERRLDTILCGGQKVEHSERQHDDLRKGRGFTGRDPELGVGKQDPQITSSGSHTENSNQRGRQRGELRRRASAHMGRRRFRTDTVLEKDSSVDPISLAKCTGDLLLNLGKLKGRRNCLMTTTNERRKAKMMKR